MSLESRKIQAYRMLYDFTRSQCGDCAATDCACKDSICSHVEAESAKRGFKFKHSSHRLRFLGCDGCVVPPHLRETCTIYLCEPAQARPDFDRKRYERLKNLCSKIDLKIMEKAERDASA